MARIATAMLSQRNARAAASAAGSHNRLFRRVIKPRRIAAPTGSAGNHSEIATHIAWFGWGVAATPCASSSESHTETVHTHAPAAAHKANATQLGLRTPTSDLSRLTMLRRVS